MAPALGYAPDRYECNRESDAARRPFSSLSLSPLSLLCLSKLFAPRREGGSGSVEKRALACMHACVCAHMRACMRAGRNYHSSAAALPMFRVGIGGNLQTLSEPLEERGKIISKTACYGQPSHPGSFSPGKSHLRRRRPGWFRIPWLMTAGRASGVPCRNLTFLVVFVRP